MYAAPPIDETMTLDEITTRHPDTILVFNALGMDICCGGDATLAEAAERDGLPLAKVLEALRAGPGAEQGR